MVLELHVLVYKQLELRCSHEHYYYIFNTVCKSTDYVLQPNYIIIYTAKNSYSVFRRCFTHQWSRGLLYVGSRAEGRRDLPLFLLLYFYSFVV